MCAKLPGPGGGGGVGVWVSAPTCWLKKAYVLTCGPFGPVLEFWSVDRIEAELKWACPSRPRARPPNFVFNYCVVPLLGMNSTVTIFKGNKVVWDGLLIFQSDDFAILCESWERGTTLPQYVCCLLGDAHSLHRTQPNLWAQCWCGEGAARLTSPVSPESHLNCGCKAVGPLLINRIIWGGEFLFKMAIFTSSHGCAESIATYGTTSLKT